MKEFKIDNQLFIYLGLLLWALVCSILITLLMAPHLFPFKAKSGTVSASVFTQLVLPDVEGWRAIHVLRTPCQCSSDVLTHLIKRGLDHRLIAETVIMVGQNSEAKASLEAKGFQYLTMIESEVATNLGLEAAPTLMLLDPEGRIKYSGGYYAKRERTAALDQEIIARSIAKNEVTPLPSFGCALSRQLRAAVDPIGLNDDKEIKEKTHE